MLEQRVDELKQIIAGNDGHNAADVRFARVVDELVRSVYDDIGEIQDMPSRALFDLFVIKVLYVGRHSRHAGVIDYLGQLLETNLDARELFPPDEHGHPRRMYFSDMLDRQRVATRFQNHFEAYRKYADSALFLTGVFAPSLRTRTAVRGALGARATGIDRGYYISTGRTMYLMASRHDLAEDTRQRDTLAKLAEHFELYADALSEMSQRYILGFDMNLIADKMLDCVNRYRQTGDECQLTNARRYAALLRLDPERVPASPPETH
jgi:hypothetical protein